MKVHLQNYLHSSLVLLKATDWGNWSYTVLNLHSSLVLLKGDLTELTLESAAGFTFQFSSIKG